MKKNLSLILNVVLIAAVGVLYYLHFSSCAGCEKPENTSDSAAAAVIPPVAPPKDIKASKIVYVNIDELNAKYEFVKDLTSSVLSRQSRLENSYQSKAQKFQQDYADLQEKASKGLLSENQANAAQEDMMKRKEELDQMQMQLNQLMDEAQKSNEEVNQSLVDYIREYNKNGQYNYILTYTDAPGGVVLNANDSLDITADIIDGLNAQYRAKKASKKK